MKKESTQQEFSLHKPADNRPWFEGWYYRLTDKDISLAVIIGIQRDEHKAASAFIQILDTLRHRSDYHSFSMNEVHISEQPYTIHIGPHSFSREHLRLQFPDIHCDLTCSNFFPLHVSRYAPTIMGPFSYLDSMQCVHSIISLYHDVAGSLRINDTAYQIRGRGYMEKDRGSSFPSSYVWFQSNTSKEVYSSFFLSIAHIPLSATSFKGCICVLMINGKQLRFASYLGCRVRKIKHKNIWILNQYPYKVYVKITQGKGCTLKAPEEGAMSHEIQETLEACALVHVYKYHRKVHEITFTHGGYECRK